MASNKVYEIVTNKIIEKLEAAIASSTPAPWRQPWDNETSPKNYVTKRIYRGVNLMLLDRETEYLTWNQLCDIQKNKPKVKLKKGSKASPVVYFAFQDKQKDVVGNNGQIEQKTVKVPFLRYYNVFSVNDVDGLEPHPKTSYHHEPIAEAEAIVNGYLARESSLQLSYNNGEKACYRPSVDVVSIPKMNLYSNLAEYYSTTFHELVHSTGHPYRLNRFKPFAFVFGDNEYSKEELVAEIGASLLCAKCGIDNSVATDNSIAYLRGWLSALKDDVTLIVKAGALSQKAADFILGVNTAENL